jgi:uncharacterized protein
MSGASPGKEFMGCGWAFPFRIEPASGRVATVADEADIAESIIIILGTAKGERVMRPDFGCGIHDLVHAPVNTATITQIRRDVTEALRRYEARIDVLDVTVESPNLIDGKLDVKISYRVRQTNQPGNIVYPFYFKEAR